MHDFGSIKENKFRLLDDQEVAEISGGTIVVTAPRPGSVSPLFTEVGGGAGGLGGGNPFMSLNLLGTVPIDLEAIAAWAEQNQQNDDAEEGTESEGTEIAPGLIDTDGDGQGDVIVVTGDPSVLDGYALGPLNEATGIIHYMYPLGPNGEPDFSQPPVLTPEGEEFACQAYAEAQEGIADTSLQLGVVTGAAGNPWYTALNPQAWFLALVGGGSLAIQSQVPPPDHCQ